MIAKSFMCFSCIKGTLIEVNNTLLSDPSLLLKKVRLLSCSEFGKLVFLGIDMHVVQFALMNMLQTMIVDIISHRCTAVLFLGQFNNVWWCVYNLLLMCV